MFILLAAVHVHTVLASRRHAYENVFAFFAYRLELNLKKKNERIVGVKCASANPDTHECLEVNPKFLHCEGSVSTVVKGKTIHKTCNLREFLSHISGNKGSLKTDPLEGGEKHSFREEAVLGQVVGEDNLNFDVDDAVSKLTKAKYAADKVPVYAKIKNGKGGYVRSIGIMSNQVGRIHSGMTADQAKENEQIFKRLRDSAQGVIDDRRADSDSHPLPKLEKAAKKGGYIVKFKRLPGGGRVFRYQQTKDSIRASVSGMGEAAFNRKLKELDSEIAQHNNSGEFKTHKPVEDGWTNVLDRMTPVACERTG